MELPTTSRKRKKRAARLPPEGDPHRYSWFTLLTCPACGQWEQPFKFDHKVIEAESLTRHATCPCGARFVAVGQLKDE